MTTEEKAKAYDEALERARILGDGKHFVPHEMTVMEYIFPELREDERIRKEIVDFLETIPASELKRIPRSISEWFAWLEKQKESHIPWYDYQKSKEAGYTIVPNEEYEQLIKQKEPKPAEWSEEDEAKLRHALFNTYAADTATYLLGKVKSLRPSWKPSEDQMTALSDIITMKRAGNKFAETRLHEIYEQLKKL